MSNVKLIHVKVIAGSTAGGLEDAYEAWRSAEGKEKTFVTVIRVADFTIAVFYMD